MQSVQTGLWDHHPPSKHASPLPAPPPSSSRHTHVTTATPAKRITFYKSGDSQFGGVRMAIHKRSFKCFDALLDDLSQKVPLPFGVRTVTTPRGTHTIKHLEQLQDGGCYLCSDRRQAKPINMELAGKGQSVWHYQNRRPQRPENSSGTPPGHVHLPYRQRRILLVKNSEPGIRRSIVLSRRSTRSLRAFLDEASEVMQFHVRKLYTAEGRRIDSVQSLVTCPGLLVCVGREAFSPMLINFIKKTSEERLPGLGSKSPGLGPRIPGNGARSPATQSIRSPPHGAQSRASEYDEGNESKKNVNFGLETKKSIIHPRSDSSTRSARFSLSSEKSCGVFPQARPSITNDDIEKRVVINKDGSLSVEMRVRFRLQNEESVEWSTQIKKSPSLTNDCCPLGQAQQHYLQQGTSESCSDPDTTLYEGVNYSRGPFALEENQCQYCYHRHEFDLWQNPTHKHSPAPPTHTSSHTMMRHTTSSSSSSSCNSRRVIRCRAQVSGSPRGSGLGQRQLVQEEMCLTEQVEERVEVAQEGDTQVEVCKVSRCCSRTEVVAIDSNLRPPSGRSMEGELMMVEDENRSLSAISSSSHILQSLKEDQDDDEDDLPPSASQCSHRNELSPTPTPATHPGEAPTSNISACSVQSLKLKKKEENKGSRASSCMCGASIHPSKGDQDQMDLLPSSMSQEPKNQKSEEKGKVIIENEEIRRSLSSLSKNTGLSASSQKSWASNICPNCGGCKRPNSSISAQTDLSAKSNRSKDTNEIQSLKTRLEKEVENTTERSHSSLTSKSGASVKSHKSSCPSVTKEASPSGKTDIEEGDTDKRAHTSLSVKSNATGKAESILSDNSHTSKVSAKSVSSCKQCAKTGTPESNEKDGLSSVRENEEGPGEEDRATSTMSAKSNLSAKSNKSHRSTKSSRKSNRPRSENGKESEESSTSQMSGRLSATTESCKCNDNGKALSPILKVRNNEEDMNNRPEFMLADGLEEERRSSSAKSCKSATSTKSQIKIGEFDRSSSGTSERSHTYVKSSKSKRSNHPKDSHNDSDLPLTETNKRQTENEPHEALESAMSVKSKTSVKSGASTKNPPSTNHVTIKTQGADEDENEANDGEPCSNISCIKTLQAGGNVNDAATTGTYSIDPHGQTLSPIRKPSSRSNSAYTRGSQSPVQNLFPNSGAGEQRGHSSLSAHSKTSSKVSRSTCSCGGGSVLEKNNKAEDITNEGDLNSSSTRQRKESGCTDHTLSRNSSGSISLGLPEDQETAGSDCGKSSVSFCSSDKKSPSLLNPPVVDIPTIEAPRQGEEGNKEGGEQPTERAGSGRRVKTSRSHRSCCTCGVQSVDQSKKKSTSSYPTKAKDADETESMTSAATTNVNPRDMPNSRSSSAVSGKKGKRKSPSGFPANNDNGNHNISRPGSKTKGKEESTASVHSQSHSGNSTALVQSETIKPSEECTVPLDSEKLGADKSSVIGSECGGSKVSSSGQKGTPVKSSTPCSLHSPRPTSKVKPGTDSTLSHSLSAADLFKESLAAAHQQSCQSKASKTSDKAHSEKSGRSQKNKNGIDQDDVIELTPECLPNASPNEVVSDWLRSIPANSSMLTLGNELNEEETEQEEKEMEDVLTEEEKGAEEMDPEDENVEVGEKTEPQEEEKKVGAEGADPTSGNIAHISSHSRNWHSSVALMKVLLSSSLGRCWSMPEVSPVYGRRLSTSARGLLDCLAQLQLIEPMVSSHEQKDRKQQYDEIMGTLQSLWLTEPKKVEAKVTKDSGTEHVSPPRSSSGVGMSSGSAGSGKSNGNQGEDVKETEILHEEEAVGKVVEKVEENAAGRDTEVEEAHQSAPAEEPMKSEEQSLPPVSSKVTDNPSSSEKSSANDGSKSPTDNERDTQEDSGSGTPPNAPRPPLSKRSSQDPDPVWVLNLLKKLEKQFMSHYIEAMAEFKVRWDLDDSLILDTMISELREEVSRRIQNSIEREMKKIQGRAGRGGRSPRPPQLANMSRDSTMTEKRRRMLKVMKNQSVKTAESLTDEETTADFSDQRSDDEYCPCDACVRKKLAFRPFKKNPLAAEAPVMMEFDLLKILQLKKCPVPPPAVPSVAREERPNADEDGRNLGIVEEEEEEETKEDIKADVVLEETIPEEEEQEEEEKDEEIGIIEQEKENGTEDDELVVRKRIGEVTDQGETSENEEEEEEEGGCTCQSESNKEEEGDTDETSDCADDEGEAGEDENGRHESGTEDEEEESDKETVKNATTCEEEKESEEDASAKIPENTSVEELREENISTSVEEEDNGSGGEESQEEETQGGSEEQDEEASEEERASQKSQDAIPAACVTDGEEADAEDSDNSKRQSDTSAEESAPEETGGTGEEETKDSDGEDSEEDAVEEFRPEQEGREQKEATKSKKEDGALLHQFTRTSVESQSGSMEEVRMDLPSNSAVKRPK